MKVKLIVEGGKMAPGPAVAQQLGPMGINLGKVISDVNEATKGFAGIKVPVELTVDSKTKTYEIQVFSPTVAELIKKELGLEKGSGKPNSLKAGNISVEQLIGLAKTKMPDLLARDLKSALKLVVGTCVSLGVLVDNKEAKEIEADIDSGVYDSEIQEEKTVPSEEKKQDIKNSWDLRKAKQDKDAKAAAEAVEAAEKAKAAADAETAATAVKTPIVEKKEEPKKDKK